MAQYVELYLDQGSDFSQTLTLTDDVTGLPLNVASYLVAANAKVSFITANVAFAFTCTKVDSLNGNIAISFSGVNSALVDARKYVYDIKTISPSNTSTRIIQGVVEISPAVS